MTEKELNLSFFLGDLVDFGTSVNDLIYDFTKDLVGTEGDDEDIALKFRLAYRRVI